MYMYTHRSSIWASYGAWPFLPLKTNCLSAMFSWNQIISMLSWAHLRTRQDPPSSFPPRSFPKNSRVNQYWDLLRVVGSTAKNLAGSLMPELNIVPMQRQTLPYSPSTLCFVLKATQKQSFLILRTLTTLYKWHMFLRIHQGSCVCITQTSANRCPVLVRCGNGHFHHTT